MTSRERLLTALQGGTPDILPWAPLIDDYFFCSLDADTQKAGLPAFCEAVGCDLMERHVPVVRECYDASVEISFRVSEDKRFEETLFKTPIGTLQQLVEVHHGTRRYVQHLVKTPEDLPVLTYIQEHKYFKPNYEAFLERDRQIGSRGIAVASVTSTPLAMMHEVYAGLENTTYFLYEETEAMKTAMEAIHKANLLEHELVAASPSPAVFVYEDTSSTTISRAWYEDYCLEQINQYKSICAAHNKPYITHMCGKLTAFRDLIANTNMDGIDSICPPSSGDVELWDAKGYWPDKLLIGGIDPSAFATLPQADLEQRIRQLLQKISGMEHVILSTGDAVAYGTPVEHFRLVAKLLGR